MIRKLLYPIVKLDEAIQDVVNQAMFYWMYRGWRKSELLRWFGTFACWSTIIAWLCWAGALYVGIIRHDDKTFGKNDPWVLGAGLGLALVWRFRLSVIREQCKSLRNIEDKVNAALLRWEQPDWSAKVIEAGVTCFFIVRAVQYSNLPYILLGIGHTSICLFTYAQATPRTPPRAKDQAPVNTLVPTTSS